MEMKSTLFALLKQSVKDKRTTKNTSLPNDIGGIITRHFGDSRTMKEVSDIVNERKEGAPSPMKEFVYGAKKKTLRKAMEPKRTNVADDLVKMSNAELLVKYGGIVKVKAHAKELGYKLNYREKSDDFMVSMKMYLLKSDEEE